MAFDMGFDFRHTEAFVTDPTYAVFVFTFHVYPHTFTNVDGLSINAGYTAATDSDGDIAATNDPRIAGYNYKANNGTPANFRIDLSSGSAPGAGNYTIDIALGLPDQNLTQTGKVLDNTTVVADLSNGGAGYARSANHYVDANAGDITATTTWTGTTKAVTFASTAVNVQIGQDNIGSVSTLAHFRLTLQTGGSVATRSMLMLMGVGA